MNLFSLSLTLFLIMDPVGSVSTFLEQLESVEPERRRWVTLRELLIALLIMLLFSVLGETLFWVLQVTETTVRLSAGVILFVGALRILYPRNHTRHQPPKGEPLLVPLAIPAVASPALLATIMLLAHMIPGVVIVPAATILAWCFAAPLLLLAAPLYRLLGESGLLACERLMGMILVLLSIQLVMDGIQSFASTL